MRDIHVIARMQALEGAVDHDLTLILGNFIRLTARLEAIENCMMGTRMSAIKALFLAIFRPKTLRRAINERYIAAASRAMNMAKQPHSNIILPSSNGVIKAPNNGK